MRPTTTLFVVNFDVERTRQRDLEDYFGQWGRLVRVQIRRNFAFVEFETVDQATAALKAAHLARLGSRTISCEYVVRGGALAAAAAPAPGSAPLETYFVGHAPAGHLVLPGGPTFFFHRAQLITGTPAAAGGGTHAWLTKAELAERLGGGALGALLLKAL